jgi:hypothetical protein
MIAHDFERPPEEPADAHHRSWYGWQTLVVDVSSLTLTVVGGVMDVPVLYVPGIVGLLVGSPAVHFGHGEVARGFASLGLRAGTALTMIGAAAILLLRHDLSFTDRDFLLVLGGGTALCAAVDAAALAYEPAQRVRDHASLRLTPFVDRTSASAGVHLFAAF